MNWLLYKALIEYVLQTTNYITYIIYKLMAQLYEIKVSLSPNQKNNLSNAYHKRETIVLRLTKDSLSGNDTLYVPSNVVKRLKKNQKLRKGMDIKLAKTNIRKQVGGSLLTSILTLGRTLAPTLGKTLGLSALAGLASEGASQVVKKISGNGIQSGGFLITQNKIDQLIAYKHLLTNKQKKDILNSLQSGGQLVVKPTKSQYGGFFYQPPPFIGTWEQVRKGGGKKKKAPKKTKKSGAGLLLGKNSPFKNVPLLNILL